MTKSKIKTVFFTPPLRVRHGRKFKKTYSKVVPILDRFTFIEKAARTDIASPETARRCRLLKSSSLMHDGAPPALPDDISDGEQFEGERPCTDNESMSWVSAPSRQVSQLW